MSGSPSVVKAPSVHYRISRTIEPVAYSRVGALEAQQASTGNRFDVPGGGVLYTATTSVATCFDEVLARMRPAPFVEELQFTPQEQAMFVTGIPASWRDQRRIYRLLCEFDLPFVNIDDPLTWQWLDQAATGTLLAEGDLHVDRGHIYSGNRRLTRGLATAIYTATNAHGDPLYGGIRYESRLGDGECWAVFADRPNTQIEVAETLTIAKTAPDLVAWSNRWHVTVH